MHVDAHAAGLDAERLSRIGDHLRSRYIEPGKIAGAQVAIVRGGSVGCLRASGSKTASARWRWPTTMRSGASTR